MSNAVQELYKDGKWCREEICRIRKAIGTKGVPLKAFDAAQHSLMFMRLYAPEEMLPLVDMQISETATRECYARTGMVIIPKYDEEY